MSVYHPHGGESTPYVRRSQRQREGRVPTGRWLVAGLGGAALLIGGYLAAMHFLQGRASVAQEAKTVFEAQQRVAPAKALDKPARRPEETARQQKQPPAEAQERFQFYEALPRARVDVDAQPLPVRLAQPMQILAGTFTRRARAEQELARLKTLGFDLKLVEIEKKGRTLYQLRTPLLHNRLEVNRLRNRLQKAGARVLVIRRQSQP